VTLIQLKNNKTKLVNPSVVIFFLPSFVQKKKHFPTYTVFGVLRPNETTTSGLCFRRLLQNKEEKKMKKQKKVI